MLGARARLTADPMIGVGDPVEPLKNYLESEKDDNAMTLLQPPATASWKSGRPTSWLASLSELWKSYVKLAPNTLIPSKKHGAVFLHGWRRHVCGVHRSSLLKVETLQVQRGKARTEQENTNQTPKTTKPPKQQTKTPEKNTAEFQITVTLSETRELWRLAIWASNSI